MNQTIITGRLTKDPELRYIPSTGKAVANFTVAVDREFGKEKKTDFFDCQIWDKLAENVANYLHKGSKCLVMGSMQQRSYEKEGRKIYIWELIANKVEFLDSKNQSQQQQTGIEPNDVAGSNFRKENGYTPPSFDDKGYKELDEQEIPF